MRYLKANCLSNNSLGHLDLTHRVMVNHLRQLRQRISHLEQVGGVVVALSSENHIKAFFGVFLRRLEDLPQFVSSESRRLVDEVYSSEVYLPEVSNEMFLNVVKNRTIFLPILIFLFLDLFCILSSFITLGRRLERGNSNNLIFFLIFFQNIIIQVLVHP